MKLTELRRQATALAVLANHVTKCAVSLGSTVTEDMLAKIGSTLKEVEDKIEILEGRA